MSLQSKEDLIASLRSKEFRDAFISSRVSNTLALQIRAMRQERGWSQAYLAELLGTSQNAIHRLESPQYGKPSITTLRRLASIFDVGLAVWFAPFSKLVDRATNLETDDILVPSFDEDQGLQTSPTSLDGTRDNDTALRLLAPTPLTTNGSEERFSIGRRLPPITDINTYREKRNRQSVVGIDKDSEKIEPQGAISQANH